MIKNTCASGGQVSTLSWIGFFYRGGGGENKNK
jgi:hypothetical protein